MAEIKKNQFSPNRSLMPEAEEKSQFEERVVAVDRISRTVSGGRRIRFRVLVVIGNKNGQVGVGIAKSNEVASAVAKATKKAKKSLATISIVNDTIPHETSCRYGSAHVILKPAPIGTSVIAGGPVRAVVELAGIRNITSKILGATSNKVNNVMATFEALKSLRSVASLPHRLTRVPTSRETKV